VHGRRRGELDVPPGSSPELSVPSEQTKSRLTVSTPSIPITKSKTARTRTVVSKHEVSHPSLSERGQTRRSGESASSHGSIPASAAGEPSATRSTCRALVDDSIPAFEEGAFPIEVETGGRGWGGHEREMVGAGHSSTRFVRRVRSSLSAVSFLLKITQSGRIIHP
jgi:hypothetical protein